MIHSHFLETCYTQRGSMVHSANGNSRAASGNGPKIMIRVEQNEELAVFDGETPRAMCRVKLPPKAIGIGGIHFQIKKVIPVATPRITRRFGFTQVPEVSAARAFAADARSFAATICSDGPLRLRLCESAPCEQAGEVWLCVLICIPAVKVAQLAYSFNVRPDAVRPGAVALPGL